MASIAKQSRVSRLWRKFVENPVGYFLDSRHGWLRAVGRILYRRQTNRFLAVGAAAADYKVTVIMTAYNTGELVERAVRSVLAQSHSNLELMVIDDASSDDTVARLRSLAGEDERLRIFSSPVNHGTYWSKNWCLALADGDFVAFHDSDDFSDPERLRVQVGAMMAIPDLAACTCRWKRVDDEGRVLMIDGKRERMAAISLMIRRQRVLEQVGFFDTVRIAADTEFIQRLRQVFGVRGLLHLRQCLYTGLLREGSLTTAPDSGIVWQRQGDTRARAVHGNRAAYYDAFTAWHQEHLKDTSALQVSFPVEGRPFPVPEALVRGCDDHNLAQVKDVTTV